jgi:large subunit ribosomal protein L19
MSVTIEELRQEGKKTQYPTFTSGQTVRVHYNVKDGDKERVQIFEGLIIAVNAKKNLSQTIVVRRVSSDGYSVEQGFPVHSPNIVKIELIKIGKVRQSKIFYMRDLRGKAARLKERFYTPTEVEEMIKEANA